METGTGQDRYGITVFLTFDIFDHNIRVALSRQRYHENRTTKGEKGKIKPSK